MLTPIAATSETHGPFRKVVDVKDVPTHTWQLTGVDGLVLPQFTKAHRREVLECGHPGKTLWGEWDDPGKKRRCRACLTPEGTL